ncbi:MAG: DUF177 domain-containing protein [Pseudomonadota bacterium]
MTSTAPSPHALRVADLPQNRPAAFDITPDADAATEIAETLGLADLRKLRLTGEVTAQGRRDFALNGTLGATVVQPCVVTLEPVTTRIDVPVQRLYLADYTIPEGDEVEMPEDDTTEALGAWIDPAAVMIEALSLALPLYPRTDGAALEDAQFAAPGVTPMTDEAARPFAGLAALKDKLSGKED